MPVVRKAKSPVALNNVGFLKNFMRTNSNALSKEATVEEGNEALAEAIAYGICKVFSDPLMASAFAAGGAVPPAGNPAQGTVLHAQISGITREV